MKKVYNLLIVMLFATQMSAQCVASAWTLPSSANSSNNVNIPSYFSSNNVSIGTARMSVAITRYGNARLDIQRLFNGHLDQLGINIGHDEEGDTNSYNNRIETQITFSTSVSDLKFRINDIDDQDVVTVKAFDQNNSPINLTAANATLFSPTDITRSGNTFYGGSDDTSNTRGSVNINYNGLRVSRIVFEYHDTDDGGTYTVAGFSGAATQLTATNDTFSGTAGTASTTTSILANDNICGVAATSGNSVFAVGTLPTGVTVNPNGTLSIGTNAVAGNYVVNYQLCDSASSSNCKSATITINIAACAAGTTAPIIRAATNYTVSNSAYNIPCGATTANISGLTASNKPTPSTITLTWHTATPATTANKITNVTALTGTTKYFAAFFDSASNCYSPTKEIVVYAAICAKDDNFTSTPITYGVETTLPNIFANDTYNGPAVSLPLSNVGLKRVLWVDMNAQVSTSNGTLKILPSTPVGIYTYTYSITDLDTDGVEDSNISYATVTFRVVPDSDGDGINDDLDVDDDNDGILDTVECSNTVADMFNVFQAGGFIDLAPSDFDLDLNAKNQNVSKDVSSKFGYPANSGAIIVSITNASVHPTKDNWWTKNGEKPSVWNITGNLTAFALLSQNNEYLGNDSKSIFGYSGPLTAITGPAGFENQTPVAGQWGVMETAVEKTLSRLNATPQLGNWRYADLNFGSKSFGFSTTTATGDPTYVVRIYLECDSDRDGIPNRLDLDSDADGCADAFEGGAAINRLQLVTAGGMLSGGSTNVNKNLCASTTCVSTTGTNRGLPQFATPIPSGYINTTGQSLGDSQNAAVVGCYCVQPPSAGTPVITKVGISVQQKQAGWPENIPNGHIALESKEKGLVITRVPHVSFVPKTTDSIASPVAGMLVYDVEDKCVKLFNGANWNCIKRSCNDPAEITTPSIN
ncbi:hypothetical protein [Epilithonimonas lactis]|nr:hypothetical protein [Epilithonimonas lactis]SEP89093.1 hypothetical protein SAMN04488097_0995 [Epilithonimonas lactis]